MGMAPPSVPVTLVPARKGDTFKIGPFTVRIMEDGSNTGQSRHSGTPMELRVRAWNEQN